MNSSTAHHSRQSTPRASCLLCLAKRHRSDSEEMAVSALTAPYRLVSVGNQDKTIPKVPATCGAEGHGCTLHSRLIKTSSS